MRNGSEIIPIIRNNFARTFDYTECVCYHYGKAKGRRRV